MLFDDRRASRYPVFSHFRLRYPELPDIINTIFLHIYITNSDRSQLVKFTKS